MNSQRQIVVTLLMFAALFVTGCRSEEPQDLPDPPEKQVKAEAADTSTFFIRPDLRQRVKVGKPFFTRIAGKLSVPGQIKVHEQKLVRVGQALPGGSSKSTSSWEIMLKQVRNWPVSPVRN